MRQVLIQKIDPEAHTEVTEPAQWLAGLFKLACGSIWESLQTQAREASQCCKQSVEDLSGGRAEDQKVRDS